MALFLSGATIIGGAASDIIIGHPDSAPNNLITGGAAADLIIADATRPIPGASVGATSGAAVNLTASTAIWSLHESPDIADATTVAHATAIMEGSGGFHWFRFDLAAGQELTVDVDYGIHAIGVDVDTRATIFSADGTTILAASRPVTVSAEGGAGSTSTNDAFITFTALTAGTYFVRMSADNAITPAGVVIPVGATYMANFSLTGQTASTIALAAGNDTINGDDGNDVIYGGAGNDLIEGGEGLDVIFGGAGNDILSGGFKKDTVNGGAGDDIFRVWGNTWLENTNGDSGNDTLDFSGHTMNTGFTLNLETRAGAFVGNVDGVNGQMTVASMERVIGSASADSFTGDINNNTFFGGTGNDTLRGGSGQDYLNGGVGSDTLEGGKGDDVYAVSGTDLVIETLTGGTNDLVITDSSIILGGGTYIELIRTTDAALTTAIDMTGNALHQSMTGNAGANTFATGGGVADSMAGLGGNDIYRVNNSADRIIERADRVIDTVLVNYGTNDQVEASVDYVLAQDNAIEVLETSDAAGTSAIDLTGNSFAQTIIGNHGDNSLNGNLGVDTMTGDDGNDVFMFMNRITTGNVDVVTDFNVVDDLLGINNRYYRGAPNGELVATKFESNNSGQATDAATRLIYEADTGNVYWDRNGDKSGGRTQIAELDANLNLQADNILML